MAAPIRTEKEVERGLLALLGSERGPLELQILGRTLLHAAIVGAAAGLIGTGFFVGLELIQRLLLEIIAGYHVLRASGETLFAVESSSPFRPYILWFLPALGALIAGIISRYAPEIRGGGGDQMIHAFHHDGGVIRRRVIWAKALASFFTLGAGGSGGREGPTMQIGGALGSTVGRMLGVSIRERRILMVAGVAAGIAAVFRTPLGAALLAVEVLYRDDFETDALVPAILASVVAYAVVISMLGESVLFAHAPRYPFVAAHLPLYVALAIGVSLVGAGFVWSLRTVKRIAAGSSLPAWLRPAVGGLMLGVLAVPVIWFVGNRIGVQGQGLGILGGGYGAVQIAITGSDWLPSGWQTVELLLLLCAMKMIAASLTIGSGGSAGDFAPSLVLGGLFGGAFGHAARLLFHDPRIDPGAFALVGMGTLYGGIAHVPVSSLILVSELAGSYDLLVPLMLTEGIAFIALRKPSLYEAQMGSKAEAADRRISELPLALRSIRVGEVMTKDRPYVSFSPGTTAAEVLALIPPETRQDTFPVIDPDGSLRGLITSAAVRMIAANSDGAQWTIAADLMQPAVSVRAEDDLRMAGRAMLAHGIREILVVDAAGKIVGFLDEDEATRAYVNLSGSMPAIES